MKRLLLLFAALVLLAPAPLPATTIYVDDDAPNDPGPGDPTVSDPLEDGTAAHPYDAIQEGIDAAIGGDTVQVTDGTYTGDGNRDMDFGGKAITLQSENGAAVTIIDCEGTPEDIHRGFYFHSSETAASVLDGFTIRNGYVVQEESLGGWGGAIRCDLAAPLIKNCIISGNWAREGGGVRCTGSPATITACTFRGNSATRWGGAISCWNGSAVAMSDCTLTGNTAGESGGGVHLLSSDPTMVNCTISGNLAGEDGGGLYSYSTSDPVLRNCKITENHAYGKGGAFYCTPGSDTSVNTITITNCTVTGNTAGVRCGGLYIIYKKSIATVTNSIFWGNTLPEIYRVSATVTLDYCDVEGGWSGAGSNNVDADPLLRPDLHLRSGSPCIDWCPDGPADDMDGEARPADIPGVGYDDPPDARTFDIGVDEFVDADGDEMPDYWEIANGLDPNDDGTIDPDNGASGDPDGEGLVNLGECFWDSDPFNADTDSDGRNDALEVTDATNLLHPDNPERTYYVNAATGDDSWDGLSAGWVSGTRGPKATIQAGIDAAITGWSYIVLVTDGVYTGEGNRDMDFGGKAITVQSEHGLDATIIDCQGTAEQPHRGFTFHSRETLSSVLDGFTITNGYAASPDDGGGILCDKASPLIENCTFRANCASGYGEGGGIGCNSGNPTINSCTFSGNSANSGGAILCDASDATITTCTLIGNTAQSGGGMYLRDGNPSITDCTISANSASGNGGGIGCSYGTTPTIADCSIISNEAENGAGLSCDHSDPTITDCTIVGNSASALGGGIYCYDYSHPTLTNCAIRDNSASYGGGLCCDHLSDPAIANCTITGNRAEKHGGAMALVNADEATITNCTIVGNSAVEDGGGIYCVHTSTATISSCILWGNESEEIYVYYSTITVTYCDIQDAAGEPWFDAATCLDTDPLVTPDGHLRAGSPCIDWCPAGPADDRDGEARPVDVPGVGYDDPPDARTFDIGADEFVDADGDGMPDWWELKYFGSATGADPGGDEEPDDLTNLEEYELYGTHPVNDDTDADGQEDGDEVADGTNPIHPDNPEKAYYVNGALGDDTYDGLAPVHDPASGHGPKATIQAGIDATVTGWGYTVLVADGIYTGVDNKELDLGGKAITVRSKNGAARCIIDCQGIGRGFWFHFGETAASVVHGFTITNGRTGGIWPEDPGGGILCYAGSPTISNCVISGNFSRLGGGIYCSINTSPIIANCTIRDNSASYGGGGLASYYGSPAISNCAITGNSADYTGGGIFCSYSSATITSCTVSANSANNSGGGITCAHESDTTIANCILWGNVAADGHEIAVIMTSLPSTLTVRHSDVQGGSGEAYVEAGCTLDMDGTCTDQDPLFVSGPLHDYYLSQVAAGQAADSPCVDAGSDTAVNLGLDGLTTRTDGVGDAGTVDMGYHSPPAIFGDVDGNGVVNGLDLTAVITAWECVPGDPLWNPAADLDGNGVINGLDLTEVIANWTMAAAAAAPPAMSEPTATQAVGESEAEAAKPGRRGSRRGNIERGKGNVRAK